MSDTPSLRHQMPSLEPSSAVFDRLAVTVHRLAKSRGVTPTPLATTWVMKLQDSVPYHRGHNRGLCVTVAVSGRKVVTLGGHRIVNDSGHIITMHGDTAYEATVEASDAEPYIALKLQLPPDLVAETLVRFTDTGLEQPAAGENALFASQKLDDALAGPLLRLVESFTDPGDCQVLAPLHLQELCYRLLRSPAFSVLKSLVSATDARLVRALRYLETHADRSDLTVAEVASEIAMSPSRFAHEFTALFGQSPMRYRRQVRLDRARRYLLSPRSTVAEAAETAGYASTSHFSREFKAAFGLAPRQYTDAMASAGFLGT